MRWNAHRKPDDAQPYTSAAASKVLDTPVIMPPIKTTLLLSTIYLLQGVLSSSECKCVRIISFPLGNSQISNPPPLRD